jgi:perosamine synthetase
MPSFTIISCALAALRLGAVPVLVDIEPETWCMDTSQLEGAISKRTRVVMPVHIYGHSVDMAPVMQLARARGIRVLEDAAEVHGAEYRSGALDTWQKCGAIGDAASFSFYANKIVTTGEGGMVVSADEDVLKRARSYQNLCFLPERRFYHKELGYNFRMTNLQAAVGVAQLERISQFIEIKRRLAAYYRLRLREVPQVRFQIEKAWARSVYWMYAIELDPSLGIDAESVIRGLRELGVEARPFFMGLHLQPALQGRIRTPWAAYPNTERAYRYGLYLPSGLTLVEATVDQVVDALKAVVSGLQKSR